MQKFEKSLEGFGHPSAKKNTNKKTKIIINVSETQYSVVKNVAKKLRWNLHTDSINNLNFDLCWIDGHLKQDFFARMQPHQKINHFPGMGILSRKNNLGKNLMSFRKKFPSQYEFFPITWNLPTEYAELQAYHECRQQGKAQTFIVKPEAGCQGRGIYLTRNIQKLKNDKCVVQRYMHKPYLIDGLKFDLRIYVLVSGIDPLRIFVYEEGLARFATEPYKAPRSQNLDNRFMHLTNYAVNKENPNFIYNESSTEMDIGHKRSLTSIFKRISEEGHNVEELKNKIYDIIIKTIITGYPVLSASYLSGHSQNFSNDMCFEILGFDVMLDHKLNPYLIQINYTPSFTTDTPLDHHIKKNLIHDTLHLLNVNDKWKKQMKSRRDKEIQERIMSGKRRKYTNEERKNNMNEEARLRNLYEEQNLGHYTKIFMLSEQQMLDYRCYYEYAFDLHNQQKTNSLVSITPSSSVTQYPYYRHYFDGSTKPDTTCSSFYKTKPPSNGNIKKDKNIGRTQVNQSKVNENQGKAPKQETSSCSQAKVFSSSKLKKDKSLNKKTVYHHINRCETDKKSNSNQGSIKHSDSGSRMHEDFFMQNQSLFQNKKLDSVKTLKKRKSQLGIDLGYGINENQAV